MVYAAEVAWDAGIVVVAAGGSDGAVVEASRRSGSVTRRILAVGATDPMGTLTTTDDLVATFASTAPRPAPST